MVFCQDDTGRQITNGVGKNYRQRSNIRHRAIKGNLPTVGYE